MTSAHSLYGPGLDGEPMEPITFAPGTASVDLERQYLDAVARAHYRQANRIDGPSRERLDPARELPNDGVDVIRALEHAAAAATSDSDRVAIACELWRARGRRAQVIRRWAESLSALFPNRRKWRAR